MSEKKYSIKRDQIKWDKNNKYYLILLKAICFILGVVQLKTHFIPRTSRNQKEKSLELLNKMKEKKFEKISDIWKKI